MESLFPALVAAAAIGLTYFMCIRPMRRGHCAMMPQQYSDAADAEHAAEIDRLRAEVAGLRRDQDSGPRTQAEAAQAEAAQAEARASAKHH